MPFESHQPKLELNVSYILSWKVKWLLLSGVEDYGLRQRSHLKSYTVHAYMLDRPL